MIIPIIIPTGYTYSCTVSGSTFKIVQCEHCRFVYVYKMTRTAAGAASESFANPNLYATQQAEAAASFGLKLKLRDDCDAVPCLECGKYQEHMVEALRRDFHLGWRNFSLFCVGAGTLAVILSLLTLFWEMRERDFTGWLGGAAWFSAPSARSRFFGAAGL
jgi:hypothetical protein